MWLNPTDIKRLASHLEAAGLKELEAKRLVVVEPGEHGVLRPRIRFRSSPVGKFCPFLINDMGEDGILRGRCSLHYTNAKPLVCRLAPLAREVNLETEEEDWREVPPVPGCPGWGASSPPLEGRKIPCPKLEANMRKALDEETRWFRTLQAALLKPS